MFWDSVVAGLSVFTYWETYVAALEYLFICIVPMVIAGMMMEKSEGGGAAAGCLSMILMPVFQVAAMAVFVLTLAPIILGLSEDAAWTFPWVILTSAPVAFFKLVGVLIAAAILLAFIPILGQLNSLQTLVLGGIALSFVLNIIESANPGVVSGQVDLYPSFWFSAGLVIIGGLMSWIGIMAAAAVATAIGIVDEAIGQFIVLPIAAIFGFVPVFMYGAWLGAQIRGGF